MKVTIESDTPIIVSPTPTQAQSALEADYGVQVRLAQKIIEDALPEITEGYPTLSARVQSMIFRIEALTKAGETYRKEAEKVFQLEKALSLQPASLQPGDNVRLIEEEPGCPFKVGSIYLVATRGIQVSLLEYGTGHCWLVPISKLERVPNPNPK